MLPCIIFSGLTKFYKYCTATDQQNPVNFATRTDEQND